MSLVIRRSRPEREFVTIPNATVRDARLSYLARGVLCELLSRPPDWEANADTIAAASTRDRPGVHEGRRAIRRVFADLEAAGYMRRTRERGERGHWRTVLVVYDTPVDDGATDDTPGGTSARTGQTRGSAGGTDVPPTDVPPGGPSTRRRSTKTENEPAPSSPGRTAQSAAPLDAHSLDPLDAIYDELGADEDERGKGDAMASNGAHPQAIRNTILADRRADHEAAAAARQRNPPATGGDPWTADDHGEQPW